jgi:hypothetical protein
MDRIGVRESLERDAHRFGVGRGRGERGEESRDGQGAREGAAKRHGRTSENKGFLLPAIAYSPNDDDIKAIARPRTRGQRLFGRAIWATIATIVHEHPERRAAFI